MKAQSCYVFWQRLHKNAKERKIPLRVIFELTYRCNFRCKHCYIPFHYRNYGELKTREVFFILEQLKNMGCLYLGFTGGEPFMRKDIMPIVRYANKLGFEIIIYTNGSLIKKNQIEELSGMRINKIDITIPAMSEIIFERITGICGSRDKVFKTIGILSESGISLGFKTCVLKENEPEIRKVQDFARNLNCQHRLDDMLSPRLDGSKEPYKYRGRLENKPAKSECELSGPGEFTNRVKFPNLKKVTDIFKCGAGTTQAAVTPLGELKMCLMIDYPRYKILESSLNDAWERLKDFSANIKIDGDYKCNKCKLIIYCKWCPAQGWLYNRKFTSCEPESRKNAELTKQLLNC
ncbi:MAG: radical SAM protein [Candidatus Omnitrophica bacterium]|nr:radical SAM protein [Candidatus Omnitrophota bacterium]MDD5237700.1 radical SAM protein [Candidatus Omnitrophota bacterium]